MHIKVETAGDGSEQKDALEEFLGLNMASWGRVVH